MSKKNSRVTSQYNEAILCESSTALLDNYIEEYALNPNEVEIDIVNLTRTTNLVYFNNELQLWLSHKQ
ncbi:MAG: hypothetical protein U5K51_06660 [Flavobacteriaceae bacterium]|nr:hypothetical protein [Flavobacteriaceae bacterium]